MSDTVTIIKHSNYYKFEGPAHLLRQIIFHVQDLVWPQWFESVTGRAAVTKYAKTAQDTGSISIHRSQFLTEERYDKVIARLNNDGVAYRENRDESELAGQEPTEQTFGAQRDDGTYDVTCE